MKGFKNLNKTKVLCVALACLFAVPCFPEKVNMRKTKRDSKSKNDSRRRSAFICPIYADYDTQSKMLSLCFSGSSNDVYVEVTDATGNVVYSEYTSVMQSSAAADLLIPMTGETSGTYQLYIELENVDQYEGEFVVEE